MFSHSLSFAVHHCNNCSVILFYSGRHFKEEKGKKLVIKTGQLQEILGKAEDKSYCIITSFRQLRTTEEDGG